MYPTYFSNRSFKNWDEIEQHIKSKGNTMYPTYEHIEDEDERRSLEALDHPDGEEYPGAHDGYKRVLRERGYDPREYDLEDSGSVM